MRGGGSDFGRIRTQQERNRRERGKEDDCREKGKAEAGWQTGKCKTRPGRLEDTAGEKQTGNRQGEAVARRKRGKKRGGAGWGGKRQYRSGGGSRGRKEARQVVELTADFG